MFDRLEDLVRRYEEITNELTEPSVVNDQNRFRKLMKEQAELQPLVDAYVEYKKCRETAERASAGGARGKIFRNGRLSGTGERDINCRSCFSDR